jgi:hypothetical protein
VTETKTTILGEPTLSPKGTKETFTKTTITETEEKIEKKEVCLRTFVNFIAVNVMPGTGF